MSVTHPEDLQDALDSELANRKRELAVLARQISEAGVADEQALCRAAVVMLYAHWEGYVRRAAELYLEFVVVQGLLTRELCPALVALRLRRALHNANETKKGRPLVDATNSFLQGLSRPYSVNPKECVKTSSNLNYKTYADIMLLLGLSPHADIADPSAPKERTVDVEHLLDRQLTACRHDVAHGRERRVTPEDYHLMERQVLELMRCVQTTLVDAAVAERYRTRSPGAP